MKKLIALVLALTTIFPAAAAESGFPSAQYVWPFITKIPMNPAYTEEVEHRGTVEKLTYTTHSYALEAVADGSVVKVPVENDTSPSIDIDALCGDQTEFIIEKSLYVYLPYGYNPAQKYNVVYALHGTGATEDYWIGDNIVGLTTRKLLDRMIDTGECAPCIVVTPTYYSIPEGKKDMFPDFWDGDALANVWPMYFWKEMRNEIIPLIDTTYSTYGNEPDARDHRGFVGLSRGSTTTVNSIILHCLDQFAYFGTFSGIWCDFDQFMATLESDEYRNLDIKFWYNGNGTADFALANHEEFCDKIRTEMSDRFEDGENFVWINFKGGTHAYNCWLPDLYNSLLVFFTK